ncbi:MAG: choice-of-anchor R domain-containing protein [Paludibaculum sp.]
MKLTVFALGALLTAAAHGATLYDTLGPSNSYQLAGSTIGGTYDQVIANLVEPLEDGQISQITLAMGHTSGQNLYRLDIVANGEGGPTGGSLFSLDFGLTGYVTTLNLTDGPSLQAGNLYWMVISGAGEGTQGAWWGNASNIRGMTGWQNTQPTFASASSVNWHLNGDSYLNAFRISSGTTPDSVAAPEPSTALLAAPALLLLGWLRRRRV